MLEPKASWSPRQVGADTTPNTHTFVLLTPASPWIPRPNSSSSASKVKEGDRPGMEHGDKHTPRVPAEEDSLKQMSVSS